MSGKHCQVSDLDRELVEASAHELVQIEKFAALPLPSHPPAFGRVVCPMPVKHDRTVFCSPDPYRRFRS